MDIQSGIITKSIATEISKKVATVMEAIADEYGMTYQPRGGRYSSTSLTPRGEFKLKSVNGIDVAQEEWNDSCIHYGFSAEHFGKSFKVTPTGQPYTICGIKTRNRKFPIIATLGGKKYKFGASTVLRSIKNV